MPETLILADGISVPQPADGVQVRYSQAAADRVLDFLGLLCHGQNAWAGKPFVVLPWEKRLVREFYGVQALNDDGEWVRYRRFLYEEIPKKNGKSEFAAALGLLHLLCDDEAIPNVGIFAVDKQNADIIYQCAKYMVEHTALSRPAHAPIAFCRDSVREIRTKYGGLMKVYSSDAKSKHGISFSAIIVDELHAQPSRDLWDVLTAGSDAARRQQAVIVLTTAGDDPNRKSIGWEIHEKCRRILAWREGHPERELDVDDPSWLPIMYGISVLTGDDPEKIDALDIWDPELWKRCNPGFGVTIKPMQFRREAEAAKHSEAAERLFRWLRLNQWVATNSTGWCPVTIYDKTQWGPSKKAERELLLELLVGKVCYGGLDLSKTTDLTALTLLFPPQDGLDTAVAVFFAWRPKGTVLEAEQRDHVPYRDWERAGFLHLCDGDVIDIGDVENTIIEVAGLYDLRGLGVDPALSWTLTPRLLAKGVQVIEIPQTMLGMSPATKRLEEMLRKHEMLHIHNTAARYCFANCRCVVDGNENIKLMKNRSIGRIDIVVAWVIAIATWMLLDKQSAGLCAAIDSGQWGM